MLKFNGLIFSFQVPVEQRDHVRYARIVRLFAGSPNPVSSTVFTWNRTNFDWHKNRIFLRYFIFIFLEICKWTRSIAIVTLAGLPNGWKNTDWRPEVPGAPGPLKSRTFPFTIYLRTNSNAPVIIIIDCNLLSWIFLLFLPTFFTPTFIQNNV